MLSKSEVVKPLIEQRLPPGLPRSHFWRRVFFFSGRDYGSSPEEKKQGSLCEDGR